MKVKYYLIECELFKENEVLFGKAFWLWCAFQKIELSHIFECFGFTYSNVLARLVLDKYSDVLFWLIWTFSFLKDDVRLVRGCMSGYIFDSSPVDFTSDLGTRFVVHPSVMKVSEPPRLASWIANGISSGLDALFLSRFESQRAAYWQTLYSSIVS